LLNIISDIFGLSSIVHKDFPWWQAEGYFFTFYYTWAGIARAIHKKGAVMFAFGNVFNRQSFLFMLNLEIKRSQRYQAYLSLLSLTFGHLDPLPGESPSISLKTLSNLLKDELRDTDIIGQGAGNRLLVMLPYTDMAEADRVRERLEKAFYDYGFGREGFTIEINEVCFPTHATNVDDLLRMAGDNIRGELYVRTCGHA
jgi:GGDEF domain-containing protein